jgi:cell division inhibitor SepF
MAVYLGLVEDEEGEHYDDYEGYDEPATASVVRRAEHAPAPESRPLRVTRADETAVSYAPPPRRSVAEAVDAYRITTMHPRTYNEARTIGEHFREGVPVIMNLSDMNDADAKRLVDFAAGLVFGLHGSIERVTSKVFLLSPEHVEVSGEDSETVSARAVFNQS